jgi:hypothetical protein
MSSDKRCTPTHGPGCTSTRAVLFSEFDLFTTPRSIEMKLTVKNPKPRNPFVAAALRRVAGSHRMGPGAQRQQAQQSLRQEVERMKHSP